MDVIKRAENIFEYFHGRRSLVIVRYLPRFTEEEHSQRYLDKIKEYALLSNQTLEEFESMINSRSKRKKKKLERLHRYQRWFYDKAWEYDYWFKSKKQYRDAIDDDEYTEEELDNMDFGNIIKYKLCSIYFIIAYKLEEKIAKKCDVEDNMYFLHLTMSDLDEINKKI